MENKIELLAPAKDLPCGLAAISCGADAVYIGADRFGAREDAGNHLDAIGTLVQHAHRFWAKIYLTLNTLLRDDEMRAAQRLAWESYECGIDGLIIQDMGLLECELPPVPLIASTQANNTTPEKVVFLEQVGFQRVILARELELDQIRAIRKAAKRIELECFVHGALCVCYSGQCYLSYAIGGRSGNRGQCAQPCRKAYTLSDADGNVLEWNRHALSLRDLNLSEHLGELMDAGITSFKIEGRLKDAAYVANVVAFYRNRLDMLLQKTGRKKASSGSSQLDFTPDPVKTFNRGYSTYFLHGRKTKLTSMDTPKMIGEPLGRVERIDESGITLDTETPLHSGDGICFFDRDRRLSGTSINSVKGRTFVPEKSAGILVGMLLYRNHDHEFIRRVRKTRAERHIGVTFTLCELPDGLSLVAVDEDGISAETRMKTPFVPADRPDEAKATIQRQLQKCGGTGFICTSVELALSSPCFVPVSTLNALRRSTLESLAAARAAQRPRSDASLVKSGVPYPEKALTYRGNVLNRNAEAFYHRHGVFEIEPAAESGLDMNNRQVMVTRYCLRHELDMCSPEKGEDGMAKPLMLADAEGHMLELRFDCRECVMRIFIVKGDVQ